jgi:hypothetical protein
MKIIKIIWNKIKFYSLWIISGLISIVAIFSIFRGVFTRKSSKKIKEKINANDKKIQRVKGNEDQVKIQKRQVKNELNNLKATVKKTKTIKRKPSPKKPRTTNNAKKNIVSKTKSKK